MGRGPGGIREIDAPRDRHLKFIVSTARTNTQYILYKDEIKSILKELGKCQWNSKQKQSIQRYY